MAWLEDFGNQAGFGDLDRGQNEFRDIDKRNFGLPGFAQRDQRLTGQAADFLGRAAPQAADSSFRGYQQGLADRLNRQLNGEDSLAQMQLRGATDANIAQQRSLAASALPGQ